MKNSKYLAILCISVFSMSAMAEEVKRAPASKGSTKVTYEKKTQLDFEQKSVDGQFLSPDGAAVKGDQNLDFDSLLDPKTNFTKELRRDARSKR